MGVSFERRTSACVAGLAGATVGLMALVIYVLGGFLLAGWNLDNFFARLSLEIIGSLLFAGGIAIAIFAIPIAAVLRLHLVSPLAVLVIVVTGWLVYGTVIGVLTAQTVFGLAIYALYLAPLYVVLYLVVGGIEHAITR